MAKTIDVFPDREAPRRKYPWGAWADGRVWELKEGEDYVNSEFLRGSAKSYARRNSLSLKFRTVRDRVFVQFTKAEP